MQVDFPPNKLIRGAGPTCMTVLDVLATQATKVAQVSCKHVYIYGQKLIPNKYVFRLLIKNR